jgi:hypothetical protein
MIHPNDQIERDGADHEANSAFASTKKNDASKIVRSIAICSLPARRQTSTAS